MTDSNQAVASKQALLNKYKYIGWQGKWQCNNINVFLENMFTVFFLYATYVREKFSIQVVTKTHITERFVFELKLWKAHILVSQRERVTADTTKHPERYLTLYVQFHSSNSTEITR